jgi:hypothetical protein
VAIESKSNVRLSLCQQFLKEKETSMARKTRKLNVQECKTSKELCKKLNPKN